MIKNIKLMLVAALAMLSMNSFAADQDIKEASGIKEKIAITNGGGELLYTPAGTGSQVNYTIISITVSEDGKTLKSGKVSVQKNGTALDNASSYTIANQVVIPIQAGTIPGNLVVPIEFIFTVTEVAADGFLDLANLTSITLPSSLEKIGENAFKGTALSALSLPASLTEIGNNAFAAGEKFPTFTAVTLPAKLQTIGAGAFEGCQNLATVTVPDGSWLNEIGDGAFAYTYMTQLDLSKATAYDSNPLDSKVEGLETIGAIFTSSTHATNVYVEKVVLPTTCATVSESAFTGCTNLSSINLENVGSIGTSAFASLKKLTEVAIGTKVSFTDTNGIVIGENAFKGCTGLKTVELGTVNAAGIDAGAFTDATGIKTLKFNDIVAAMKTTPFADIEISQLDFQKYVEMESAIPEEAFTKFADKGVVNYNITIPAGKAAKKFIAQTAFSTSDVEKTITMNTIAAIEQEYAATGICKVNIVGGFVIGNSSLKLLKDNNSNNYYYYYNVAAGKKISIDKQNGDANVTVYQAYADANANEVKIYLQPLFVENGKYVIEGVTTNQVVIIKSDKEDGVKAASSGADNTMVYNATSVKNDLQILASDMVPIQVMYESTLLNSGANNLYFLKNPVEEGFGFAKYNQDTQTEGLYKNTVYLTTAASAAARLSIIWLDEEGNTTGIQTVEDKTVVNNGAIYNLAGQQVDSSYKGVVIKNGKKMIQK